MPEDTQTLSADTTEEQSPIDYTRWLDFSTRMARAAWPDATERRRQRIAGDVEAFISLYDPDPDALGGEFNAGWDGNIQRRYHDAVADRFYDYFDQHRIEEWRRRASREGGYYIDQLACCIRAGLNAAGDENAGVVGFTVGMLRRMYPDGLPDWLIAQYEVRPECPYKALAEAPDDAEIWL